MRGKDIVFFNIRRKLLITYILSLVSGQKTKRLAFLYYHYLYGLSSIILLSVSVMGTIGIGIDCAKSSTAFIIPGQS